MEHRLEPQVELSSADHAPVMRVRRVAANRPWAWLAAGAGDLRRLPLLSLGLGALVSLVGGLLLGAGWKAAYIAPALLGGFLLGAPFLALPFYALSRQLELGQGGDLLAGLRTGRANAGSLALFGLMLALSYIAWERLAAIVFALFYRGQLQSLSNWPWELLFSGQYVELLLAYVLIGGALAALVFALGVVSAPMLLDRPRVDAISAMLTSLQCCSVNRGALALWALLIAGLTLLGFATLLLGMIVIFPLLAHASWHAYRDLVEPA